MFFLAISGLLPLLPGRYCPFLTEKKDSKHSDSQRTIKHVFQKIATTPATAAPVRFISIVSARSRRESRLATEAGFGLLKLNWPARAYC